MRWRHSKLDWGYGLGELVIVTAGVLIALAVDQWNTGRLERIEESEIVASLMADLESDVAGIDAALAILSEKDANLGRLSIAFREGDVPRETMRAFLGDVIGASRYGWTQRVARRSTFNELLGAGRFSRIRDASLRSQISEYYAQDLQIDDRIDERETQYPDRSYGFAPRVDEFELDPNLSDSEVEESVRQVFESDLSELVVAEINFSRFVRQMFAERLAMTQGLMASLRTYAAAAH